MKKHLVKLVKIDFVLLMILFSLSAFIKVSTFPKGIGVDDALYWDEAKTISISQYYLGDSQKKPFHGPLFFYINYFTAHINDSLLLLRLPSILFSFATILLFYLFAKIFFDLTTAFVASLLLTISPAFNAISIYMMPHIFYCFFSLAALMMYMLAIKKENGKYLIWAFLFAGLAFLTTILGLIIITALLLSLIIVKNSFISLKKDKNAKKSIKISKYVWLSFTAMLILILICAPMLILSNETISRYTNTQNIIHSEKIMWQKPFLSLQFIKALLREGIILKFFIIIGGIAALIIPFKNRILLPILIYLLIYSFVMSFTNGFITYTVTILMFLYLFFSEAAFTITGKINSHFATITFIILIILGSIAFIIQFEKKDYSVSMYNYSLLFEKAYDYLKSKNESSIYVLATASFVFKYYAERDGINVTFITLPFPNQNFNFTTLPHFLNYEYVIYWNNAPMTFINKNSSFYEFMQNVYTNCKSDANITDSTFSEGLPKILVFNCKNVNLST